MSLNSRKDKDLGWWLDEGMTTKEYIRMCDKFMKKKKEIIEYHLKEWEEYYKMVSEDIIDWSFHQQKLQRRERIALNELEDTKLSLLKIRTSKSTTPFKLLWVKQNSKEIADTQAKLKEYNRELRDIETYGPMMCAPPRIVREGASMEEVD